MLIKDKSKRLGSSKADFEDVKAHPFFNGIDFTKLENRELEPPFKPNIPEKDYTKFFDQDLNIDETVLKRREKNLIE